MLLNYIRIALRNLAKHKFFSLLNIAGLALGMSSCLTVILIIRDQLSYDRFHTDPGRIFRITCQQPEGTKVACVPYPLGETLLQDFSIAESEVSCVRGLYGIDATTTTNLTLPLSGFFTESSFFEVFGFRLEAGNAATALNEPQSIVLSRETAQRFFGNNNPIGKSLVLKDKGTYRVTGVVAPPPGKTHLDFECLASVHSLSALEAAYTPEQEPEKILDNWGNWYMSYVYVRLHPGQNRTDLANVLTVVTDRRAKAGQLDKDLRYSIQNINEITPKAEQLANDLGGGAPWFFIWGMMAFVLILTIFPCLNYANMAVSQALSRTREVGIRKAIGARTADVKKLILAEALMTSFLALLLAWVLHLPLNRFVEKFFPAAAKLDELQAGISDWLVFVSFAFVVGLLAGWIPARRLAKMDTSLALRGNNGEKHRATRFSWRTGMLVGQFTLSLVFIIVVATLWSQMRFMTLADYGFQKENLLTIQMQGNKPAIVAAEMKQAPFVLGASMTTVVLATNNLQSMPLKLAPGGDDLGIHCAMVDQHYIPVMGLSLIAGENFPENKLTTQQELLILNEKALEKYQLGSPAEAVGKTLWLNDSTPARVQGVVRDFHYRIFEHRIEPFALSYSPPENGHLMHVRIAPGDPGVALASLGSIWKKIDPIHPFKATFMEDAIEKSYGHVRFVGGLVGFFALLSLTLACMGLLGAVTYSVSNKVREIGIRKVLGATAAQVTLHLSRRFLILLGIAVALALPVGYFLANQLLNLFVYRIPIGGLILGGSTAVLLLLGLLTIGVQSGKAALANPARSLKSD